MSETSQDKKKEETKFFAVRKELLESILKYLSPKPFEEVSGFIAGIMDSQPISIKKQEEKKEK